jgi:hypothetical protein
MVFKIFAVLCIINAGDLNQNLCFKTEVPLDFKNIIDCQMNLNKLVDYLNADLKKRQITLIMKCNPDMEKINI